VCMEHGRLCIHDSGDTTRIGTREKNNKEEETIRELDLTSRGLRVRWILCLYGIWVGCLGLLGSLGFEFHGKMTSQDLSACSGRLLWDVTCRGASHQLSRTHWAAFRREDG